MPTFGISKYSHKNVFPFICCNIKMLLWKKERQSCRNHVETMFAVQSSTGTSIEIS